jgi:thiamine biosynthesis lipoprotein
MGCHMLAVVDSSSPAAERALQRVPAWFEEWEQALSRFRFDSELSQLNRSAGQPVTVSETLWDVFHAARQAEMVTGGLVRPTVLDALVRAGYDRSFDLLPALNEASLTSTNASVVEGPDLATEAGWDAATRSLYLPESVHLDFGGLAKGWTAQKAAARLEEYGPALVETGGDIAISGPDAHGQPWALGIRDPFQSDTHFETLRVERGGIATSGIDYHRWLQGGVWNHHIIDPRTGLPAETDILTATVIAPDAVQAEAAAKAVLIAGSHSGLDWLEADQDLAGVLVLQSGERVYSQRMTAYLWR